MTLAQAWRRRHVRTVEAAGGAESSDAVDSGNAVIEVVFLSVLVLIPVIYIVICVLRLEATTLAVAQAARDAGRLIETAPDPATVMDRVYAAVRTDLADQSVPAGGVQVRIVAPGADCRTADQVPPSLRAGASYDVCVIATVSLPGVPTILTGSSNTVTGVYGVTVDALREGG